jgi:hypothetical protein
VGLLRFGAWRCSFVFVLHFYQLFQQASPARLGKTPIITEFLYLAKKIQHDKFGRFVLCRTEQLNGIRRMCSTSNWTSETVLPVGCSRSPKSRRGSTKLEAEVYSTVYLHRCI